MKIFNKYTYLFLGILLLAGLIIFNFLPDLNREEFDQEVIDNIVEGVTTTTIKSLENENDDSNEITSLPFDEEIVLSDSEESNIQEILKFNSFENKITGFDTYLLIGSDERSPEIDS